MNAMPWVLILIVMVGNHVSVSVEHFYTKAACEQAGTVMKNFANANAKRVGVTNTSVPGNADYFCTKDF